MSNDVLEQRLAKIEQKLDTIMQRLDQRVLEPGKRGLLSAVGSMADDPGFEAAMAYGRYFRKTGKQAPPDWKPGDPIPEPECEE